MDSDHEQDHFELDTVQNLPEKRKKKRRGGVKKKKNNAPTGFEGRLLFKVLNRKEIFADFGTEYYADPPTTPAEALREQQELYAR